MNEKGFATILGLCLILSLALLAGGIHISEQNHADATQFLLEEAELENAAKRGIYVAAEKISKGEVILEASKRSPYVLDSREGIQHEFNSITVKSETLGEITVKTWGEYVRLKTYKVTYNEENASGNKRNVANKIGEEKEVYTLFSWAEGNNKDTGQKVVSRAFAYILADDDNTELHFMGVVPDNRNFIYKD